jgi:hypothetical protein
MDSVVCNLQDCSASGQETSAGIGGTAMSLCQVGLPLP